MEKIDQELARALDEAIKRRGGKNAVISRELRGKLPKITPQGIGLYRRGKRSIPLKFIKAWRETFEEDLEKLTETTVSRETKSKQGTKSMDMDVWEVIKGSNKIHEESHRIFKLEFDRLWGLIEKFGPSAPPVNKEGVQKNGN